MKLAPSQWSEVVDVLVPDTAADTDVETLKEESVDDDTDTLPAIDAVVVADSEGAALTEGETVTLAATEAERDSDCEADEEPVELTDGDTLRLPDTTLGLGTAGVGAKAPAPRPAPILLARELFVYH